MNRSLPSIALSLSLAVGLSACASAPATNPAAQVAVGVPAQAAATPDCGQLEADIVKAQVDQRSAAQKQQDAWKTIVPFAVAAQYLRAKSAAEQADQRVADLSAQFLVQGCSDHGQ